MNRLESITLLVSPPDPAPIGLSKPPRELHSLDELLNQTAQHAGVSGTVVEKLSEVPPSGYLLVYGGALVDKLADRPDAKSILSRVVVLSVHRSQVFDDLETYGLAAAIEQNRFFQWEANRAQESGHHIFGLRTVGEQMGAVCAPLGSPFASAHYCNIDDTRRADLPDLLAAYLRAHADADAAVTES